MGKSIITYCSVCRKETEQEYKAEVDEDGANPTSFYTICLTCLGENET